MHPAVRSLDVDPCPRFEALVAVGRIVLAVSVRELVALDPASGNGSGDTNPSPVVDSPLLSTVSTLRLVP